MESTKGFCELHDLPNFQTSNHFVTSPFFSNLTVEKFPIDNNERPYRYTKNTLLVHVNNESKWFTHLGKEFEKLLLLDSLRVWSRYCNLRFKYTKIKGDADIILDFRTLKQDPYLKRNILGYAWFPQEKAPSTIVINDDFGRWTLDGKPIPAHIADPEHYDSNSTTKFKTYNIRQLLRHEGGHKIGLLHDDYNKNSIMYPYYQNQLQLSEKDIERIRKYYGKKTLKNRLLEHFLTKDNNPEWIEDLSN